jgi:hypothetical protein
LRAVGGEGSAANAAVRPDLFTQAMPYSNEEQPEEIR